MVFCRLKSRQAILALTTRFVIAEERKRRVKYLPTVAKHHVKVLRVTIKFICLATKAMKQLTNYSTFS